MNFSAFRSCTLISLIIFGDYWLLYTNIGKSIVETPNSGIAATPGFKVPDTVIFSIPLRNTVVKP
jgi:hypothetical protein